MKKPLVDGLVERKSLELIHAIYESIETKKDFFLDSRPKSSRLGYKIKVNIYLYNQRELAL